MNRSHGIVMTMVLTGIVVTAIVGVGVRPTDLHAQADTVEDAGQSAPLRIATKEIEPFVFTGDDLTGY